MAIQPSWSSGDVPHGAANSYSPSVSVIMAHRWPASPTANTATVATNSSGDDDPAAIKVAPATSGGSFIFSMMISSAATKKSSHTSASPKHA